MTSQEKRLREQIVNHIAKFSFASFIAGIGWFLSNYFGALILGPTVWGVWQGAGLILQYGAQLHLGVQNGMQRELPILRGKRETGQQVTIINVTFTFSLVVAVVVSLGVLFSTFLIGMESELRMSLQFIAVIIFFKYISGFYGALFRANNEFDIVSRITVIDGIGNFFSVILVLSFGFLGFLGGQVLRLMTTAFYSWWRSSYIITLHWNNKVLKSLIVVGSPIMLMVFADVIFTTVDRLLILKFLGAQSLGFYSLGNLIFMPLMVICSVSNSVMYPRFAERYGETGDLGSLRRYIIIPMENLAVLISIFIGAIYIALPLLTKTFLPNYVEGISAARILMFGLFFYAIAGMAGNMFLTINKQVLRLVILLGSALFNLSFDYAALRMGYGIVGVALGTCLAYLIFFLTLTVMAMRYALTPSKEFVKLMERVLLPLCYVGGVIWLITHLIEVTPERISNMVVLVMTQEVIFMVLCGWFVYGFLKKLNLGIFFYRR